MSGTASCDHAAVEVVARACQRAAINGTQVRLVVTAPVVRRVLSLEGLDRLVPIYPSAEAADRARPGGPRDRQPRTAARPGHRRPEPLAAGAAAVGGGPGGSPPPSCGTSSTPSATACCWPGRTGRSPWSTGGARRCSATPGRNWPACRSTPCVPSDVRGAHLATGRLTSRHPSRRPMAERARLAALRRDGATLPVEISLSPVPTASEPFVLAVIRDASAPRPPGRSRQPGHGRRGGQPAASRDLLDRVVHRLFQVGLTLQAAGGLPGEAARARLAEALDQLDDVIQEIRDYAFASGDRPLGDRAIGPVRERAGRSAEPRPGRGTCGRSRRRPGAGSPGRAPGPRDRAAAGTRRPASAANRRRAPGAGVRVRSASSTGNRPPPDPVASQRSAIPTEWSAQDSSRACTRTSLETPATPTRAVPYASSDAPNRAPFSPSRSSRSRATAKPTSRRTLIPDEHPRIPPAAGPRRAGTLVPH